jgi:glycosyltransferase involved in cell wall biosynthesis
MRIAQVAPLYESVPPKTYGGTERIAAYLSEELVALGHEVTLFASGDSRTAANLVATIPQSLRLGGGYDSASIYETVHIEHALRRADQFDLIHFHTGHIHYPATRRFATPHVTTLHGRLDLQALQPLYTEFSDAPVISISDAQRRPLPQANWRATIHHGLPPSLLRFNPRGGDHFVFLGRISREKRVDRAVEIARQVGVPLRVAAKIDPADRHYYASEVKHLLNHPLVDFVGEVTDEAKQELLGGAKALLFPIDWPEPFGLVMIEAMACGTPVIAWNCGSVPEIVEDGLSGFIVGSMDEAIDAARCVDRIDRRSCRLAFERRYTARRMAEDHVRVYERLIAEASLKAPSKEVDLLHADV